jgi:hypothetical protein
MREVEKKVIIISVRGQGESVIFLMIRRPPRSTQTPDLTRIIQPMTKTDTQRVVHEMVNELKKAGALPSAQMFGSSSPKARNQFSITISKDEYDKMGRPAVFDELKLRIATVD